MRNRKLQIGVIGCGQIAMNKHLPALAKLSDACEIAGFSDTNYAAAQEAARAYGIADACVTQDYRQLLDTPWIDVVHILTPNAYHAPIAVAAFDAGKHVMLEKPMAIGVDDAAKIMTAWRRSGKKFTVAYQNRFREEVRALYEAREDLGEIYFAKAHAIRRRGVPTWGVFTDRAKQGGGPLIDIGTHALDLTLWLMDNWEPVSVSGQVFCKLANTLHGSAQGVQKQWDPDRYDVEDSAFGFIKMKNGALVYLEASWALNILEEREAATTLCGTKGGAEIKSNGIPGSGDVIYTFSKYGQQLNCTPKKAAPIAYAALRHGTSGELEAKAWIDAIVQDTEPIVTPQQAFVVTQVLDAIYQSARIGKEVVIPEKRR